MELQLPYSARKMGSITTCLLNFLKTSLKWFNWIQIPFKGYLNNKLDMFCICIYQLFYFIAPHLLKGNITLHHKLLVSCNRKYNNDNYKHLDDASIIAYTCNTYSEGQFWITFYLRMIAKLLQHSYICKNFRLFHFFSNCLFHLVIDRKRKNQVFKCSILDHYQGT